MKTDEFIKNVEHICFIIGHSFQKNIQKELKLPFTLSLIKSLSCIYDNENILNIKEINEKIVFNLYIFPKLDLFVKTEDINNEKIEVFYLFNNRIQLFSESLSITLLINLSLWGYDKKVKHKTSFKERTSEFYMFIKNNYSFICSDRPSINQLYFSANGFMIFMFDSKEYFISSNDEQSLIDLQQQISEIKEKGKNKEMVGKKIKFESDYIINAKIIEDKNILIGNIVLENKNIEIEIDPESKTNSNFDKLILMLKKMLEFYNKNNDFLQSKISSEVIDESYQQSDYKPNDKDYNKFKKHMRLKKIQVFPSGFMLIYNIKTDRGEKMYVQLNELYNIEEITIN